MSRRKQSNPKPLKRKSEDILEEVADLLHLPTDIFSVRDPEDDVHEYTVFTKQHVREGLTFGPFVGHVIHSKEESLHVIETKDQNGARIRFALTDESGGWLKLLKPATSCEECNVVLFHNESVVWCTVTTDIEPDTELLVSHRYSNDVTPPRESSSSPEGYQSHTHSKNLFRKNKANRIKCRERDESRSTPKDDAFNDVREDTEDRKITDPNSTQERRSPYYFGENEKIYNGGVVSESTLRHQPTSPVSPPAAVASPKNLVQKREILPIDSPTNDTIGAPYLNGCNYPPAFPYGSQAVGSSIEGLFKCETCEVSFSSRRVLEVHQTYYCQGKQSGHVASSDTDTEDTIKDKTDSTLVGSPTVSEDGDSQVSKDITSAKASQPEASQNEDSVVFGKRRRTISFNDSNSGSSKSSRLFKCPYCSYSSDKKASLTRHVRMHGTSPSVDGHCEIPVATPPMARYCANCDIQFASYKNYQVHKEYYCNTRHVHKSIASSPSPNVSVQPQQNQQQLTSSSHSSQPRSPENASGQSDTNAKGYNSMVLNQPLYAAISTSPLILVPCSYVAGGGLSPAAGLIPAGNIIIPNPSSSPDANSEAQGPNVIPTYTVMPGSATDLNTVPSPSAAEDGTKDDAKLPKTPKDKEPKLEPPKSPKERSKEDTEKPLDLSFRKRDADAKPSSGKVATDSVVPSSAFTSTSSSASSSSEENSVSMTPAPSLPILPLINPAMDLNIISRAQLQGLDPAAPTLPPVLAPPQMLVKQGTSKCKECNIVFYKHENYLVHKNQYCAARGVKRDGGSPERVKNDESDSMDREETATRSSQKSPISSPRLNNLRTPPAPESNDPSETSSNPSHAPPVFQYYCVACGIKYTSIDNLRAHQLYYCPKRDMNSTQTLALVPSFPRNTHEFKCSKCKNAYPTEDLLKQHPCVVQRKCPYCDVYCPTLSAAQRHLVTHTGIKSFKCSLCGYKGHTLRGMRTHIRIHLDKNSSTPEEAYILCMDEGGAEIGCASRKSSGVRVNSERIKSVISTEPPHGEIAMAVSPISGPSPNVVPSDIVAIKAVPDDPVATGDTTHWCQICGYSSSYKGNVVRHVKLVHKDLISTQTMSNIVNSRPSVDNSIKPNEPLEHTSRGTPQESLLSAGDHSNSSSSMDVKPMINGIVNKTEQHLRLEDKPLMLKTEAVSPPPPSGGGSTSKGIKRPLPEDGQCPTGAFKTGPKYCKSCDISFNYLSNFLAHKKFYCTPRPGEVSNQESTSVQSVQ